MILGLLFLGIVIGIGYIYYKVCQANNVPSPILWGGLGIWKLINLVILLNCLVRIIPGEVGVVVDLLGNSGVEEKELGVGFHMVYPWQEIYRFPIYEQNHQWSGDEGFNFQTIEGLSVHADIGISYNVKPDKVHEMFWKYRRGMEEITHVFVRNNIRDAINRIASKMRIEELYGEKKEEFFLEVHKHIQKDLNEIGFNISHIYIIGKFEVPQTIMAALNQKIEATQKAQQRENELRETEAQARKEIAKAEGEARSKVLRAKAEAEALYLEAKAQADSNQLLTKSLSKELIQWETVNKWDGVMPKIVGNGTNLLMQLPMEENK